MTPQEAMGRMFPKFSTVYTVMVGRSRSGMVRRYRVLTVTGGRIHDCTAGAAELCGDRVRESALEVRGAGFSGPQSIAQGIAFALYGDAAALKYESV